jgi:hypothetical protein
MKQFRDVVLVGSTGVTAGRIKLGLQSGCTPERPDKSKSCFYQDAKSTLGLHLKGVSDFDREMKRTGSCPSPRQNLEAIEAQRPAESAGHFLEWKGR